MTAALALLGPVWNAIKAFLAALLTFCSKPPGSYLALVAAGLLAWWISGQIGYDRGKSDCEAAHKAAVAAKVIQQHVDVVAVVGRSNAVTAVNTAIDQTNKAKVKYVVEQAAALPDAEHIAVPAAIADQLRDIN